MIPGEGQGPVPEPWDSISTTRRPLVAAWVLLAVVLLGSCGDGEGSSRPCDDTLPDNALVIVYSPEGGEEVESGFEVSGCSRTFESNVQWQLTGRDGEVLASGHTTGGGVDGPARFAFSVEYEATERQVGRLTVFEEDVAEGQGFPPPRAVVPVILAATE